MSTLSPSEMGMWDTSVQTPQVKMTDDQINDKYNSRVWRIVTESNREQLPNFVEALKRPGWMELRPFYQRRRRWDVRRQSKLIESFIMNIPVPPLFVYEADLAKYEVMDGQQRINAIREFYSNNLRLRGLERWPELNGRSYSSLPSEIRKGIDRRSVSYIVLLKESADTTEEQMLLRQLVFERLNTGGVQLEKQEIRNCLYHSRFNDLLFELARHPVFRTAWGLPAFSESELDNPRAELLDNSFYSKMTDIEVILRFFALRHAQHYQRGMQGFLDIYMFRSRRFVQEDLDFLRDLFDRTIALGHDLYGHLLFRPWDATQNEWERNAQRAFADAVMVGLSRHLAQSGTLRDKATSVVDQTKDLFTCHAAGTFTGKANTKDDVNTRIGLFDEMLSSVAAR